jgi:NOL1/NOP2/fmu family ribosome biogenesis protein
MYKILNSKEKKEIFSLLKDNFSFDKKIKETILLNEKKGKIILVSDSTFKIDFGNHRLEGIGLYFGEVYKNQIRLSIEGSQIIGKHAKKNVLNINKKILELFYQGEEIILDDEFKSLVKELNKDFDFNDTNRFIILKMNTDFLGCVKYCESKFINYIPKNRRLKEIL